MVTLLPRETTARCKAPSAGCSAEHDVPVAVVGSHTLNALQPPALVQKTSTLSPVVPSYGVACATSVMTRGRVSRLVRMERLGSSGAPQDASSAMEGHPIVTHSSHLFRIMRSP